MANQVPDSSANTAMTRDELERQAAEWARKAEQVRSTNFALYKDFLRRADQLRIELLKGDIAGHEFHGNQYSGGSPTGGKPSIGPTGDKQLQEFHDAAKANGWSEPQHGSGTPDRHTVSYTKNGKTLSTTVERGGKVTGAIHAGTNIANSRSSGKTVEAVHNALRKT